jgi:hypothetical protein
MRLWIGTNFEYGPIPDVEVGPKAQKSARGDEKLSAYTYSTPFWSFRAKSKANLPQPASNPQPTVSGDLEHDKRSMPPVTSEDLS